MKKILILAVMVIIGLSSQAQSTKYYNLKKNLAIQGYDPVSYFDGAAKEGIENIFVKHEGVMYQFSSELNKNKFSKNPERYLPQYGGWCAYAMGVDGSQVKIDPETFKVVDDKLYLFYNFGFTNTLKSWNEDEANLKKKADINWNQTVNDANTN